MLDRLPPWATMGVGSLPFADATAAIAHVAAAYDVPFCPQLPRLDGDMITEWLGADPRRCGWSPERDRERPRAWDALLAQLDERPPAHRVVKLQVTGPVTLACALEQAGRHDARALARELATWLAANVAGQVAALRERGLDALVVVDEPSLHMLGDDGIDAVWDPLRASAGAWGLHLCGPVPWQLVERAEPDVLSFDLALDRFDARVLNRLLARGGRIAWGVVQPHRTEHVVHALSRSRAALAAVPASGERSLLTPSCGSGRMSRARELELAGALRETALTMRAATRTSS